MADWQHNLETVLLSPYTDSVDVLVILHIAWVCYRAAYFLMFFMKLSMKYDESGHSLLVASGNTFCPFLQFQIAQQQLRECHDIRLRGDDRRQARTMHVQAELTYCTSSGILQECACGSVESWFPLYDQFQEPKASWSSTRADDPAQVYKVYKSSDSHSMCACIVRKSAL